MLFLLQLLVIFTCFCARVRELHVAEGFQSVGGASGEQLDDHCIDHYCEIGAEVCRSEIAARRAGPKSVVHGRLSPTNTEEIVVDTARVLVVWEFF